MHESSSVVGTRIDKVKCLKSPVLFIFMCVENDVFGAGYLMLQAGMLKSPSNFHSFASN